MLNCIIVDDEEYAIDYLKKCLRLIPQLNLLNVYQDPFKALAEILKSPQKIDFLFLDIDMPHLSGLDLALAIRKKVDKLIFVTAHTKYSLKAYEVLCNQYLLKPYTTEQFITSINKLIDEPAIQGKEKLEFIFVKSGPNGKYDKISCENIISISALEHYIVVNTTEKKYIQYTTMRDVELSLASNQDFFRIHKSHIISKSHITAVQANVVIMDNQEQIPIGTTYKTAFANFMESNSLG